MKRQLWGLAAVAALLALLCLVGCRRPDPVLLNGYQLLHWSVCIDQQLLPPEDCERHMERLRPAEQRAMAGRWETVRKLWKQAKPHVERLARAWLERWIAALGGAQR